MPPKPVKIVPPKPPAPPSGEDGRLKPVEVSFFYPEGEEEELASVKDRFREVIKKHKLKFRLESIFDRAYQYSGKINYAFFSELCKTNNVTIAVVVGPPESSSTDSEDFANLLGAVMDDAGVSLQLIPWAEKGKDYRYLNLALDITLLRHKA